MKAKILILCTLFISLFAKADMYSNIKGGFLVLKDLGISKTYNNSEIHQAAICGLDGIAYLADINIRTSVVYDGYKRLGAKYNHLCDSFRVKYDNPNYDNLPQDVQSLIYQKWLELHRR